MSIAVKLSDDLVIKDTLLAAQEAKAGMLAPYQFGDFEIETVIPKSIS